jgi:hypothetical protein
MRVLLKAQMDVAAANEAVKSGAIGRALQDVMQRLQPEAAYLGAFRRQEDSVHLFRPRRPIADSARQRALFQITQASVEIIPVMNADDLQAGLRQLGESKGNVASQR